MGGIVEDRVFKTHEVDLQQFIALKSGWIMETTPKSSLSSQFNFIKKEITYESSASAL